MTASNPFECLEGIRLKNSEVVTRVKRLDVENIFVSNYSRGKIHPLRTFK